MIRRRLFAPVALALVALLPPAAAPLAAEVYDSPQRVQPLLVGSEVPSVEVLTLDGDPVDLRQVVGKKKAVVIFYRGGW